MSWPYLIRGVALTDYLLAAHATAIMVNDPLMQAIQLTDPISGWGYTPDLALLGVLGARWPTPQ